MTDVSTGSWGFTVLQTVLTLFPYNSLKLYYVKTKINQILIYGHVHCIESF